MQGIHSISGFSRTRVKAYQKVVRKDFLKFEEKYGKEFRVNVVLTAFPGPKVAALFRLYACAG